MFEVGDYVKVKEDIQVNRTYHGVYFPEEMAQYRGKSFVIQSIVANGIYLDTKDVYNWCFDETMLIKHKGKKPPKGKKIIYNI